MDKIIQGVVAFLVSVLMLIVNIAIIHAFVSWAYSNPIGTEGKVIVGLVALVFTVGEVVGLYLRFFSD
jgi:hypothetical protein